MHRSKDVKFVHFHVATDFDGPIQTLLESAVAQPVHLGAIVDEFPVEGWRSIFEILIRSTARSLDAGS